MPDNKTVEFYSKCARELSVTYNGINPEFMARVKELIIPGGRVLDVGCGSGRDLAAFHDEGMEVMGIEPVAEFRRAAVKAFPALEHRIIEGSLPDDIPDNLGKFDIVHCSAVLMHLDSGDVPKAILAVRELVKPGGLLHLSFCPDRPGVDSQHRAPEGRLFNPINPGRLLTLLEKTGFELVDERTKNDALGRPGIQWISLVFRKIAA